jgi:hypothetical protein
MERPTAIEEKALLAAHAQQTLAATLKREGLDGPRSDAIDAAYAASDLFRAIAEREAMLRVARQQVQLGRSVAEVFGEVI